ncbi:MAG: hypothetical protein IJV00_06285 [Clostridia bacterium]|nr:hypothetical protein [Clostridia bacterium]
MLNHYTAKLSKFQEISGIFARNGFETNKKRKKGVMYRDRFAKEKEKEKFKAFSAIRRLRGGF